MLAIRAVVIGLAMGAAFGPGAAAQPRASSAAKQAFAQAKFTGEPAFLQGRIRLTRGVPHRGTLTVKDSVLSTGSHYQAFRYRVSRGETLDITLSSTQFDVSLMLVRFSGPDGPEVLAENDDWDDGTDARIILKAQVTEDLAVVVSSAAPEGTGSYRLLLTSTLPVNWGTVYPGRGSPAGKYALIVGISDYPGEESDLMGPREDAAAMATLLVERYGFLRRNVVVLLDSAATRERVIQAFTRHLGQAGENGSAVFYYSGHGMQLQDNQGLGPDVDPEADGRDEALFLYGRHDYGTVLLDDELGALAQRLKTNRAMLILDACYSGTGTRNRGAQAKGLKGDDLARMIRSPTTLGLDSVQLRGLQDPSDEGPPEGHVLLAASKSNEVSWSVETLPDSSGPAGLFTWMLVKELLAASSTTRLDSLMKKVQQQTLVFGEDVLGVTQTPQAEGTRIGSTLRSFFGDPAPRSKGVIPYRRRAKRP